MFAFDVVYVTLPCVPPVPETSTAAVAVLLYSISLGTVLLNAIVLVFFCTVIVTSTLFSP